MPIDIILPKTAASVVLMGDARPASVTLCQVEKYWFNQLCSTNVNEIFNKKLLYREGGITPVPLHRDNLTRKSKLGSDGELLNFIFAFET